MPNPVQYLPAGAYPGASAQLLRTAEELLRDCGAYDRESENRLHPGMDRQRGLAHYAVSRSLRVLTDNFMALQCLQRTNWHRSRPRLRLSMTMGRTNLTLYVFPSRDGFVLGRAFRYGQPWVESVVDFKRFPVNHMEPLRGQRVLQLVLEPDEAAMLSRDNAWVYLSEYRGVSNQVLGRMQRWQAQRRQLLYLSFRAFVHRLTLAFDCELESELLAYGPHRLLDLRSLSDEWGSANRDDFDPDSNFGFTGSVGLDPRMTELLVQQRVYRSTFNAFVREYLLPSVPPEQHALTIAEYLGLREQHLVTPELAKDLTLSLDEDYQAQALRRRMLAEPAEFHKALAARGFSVYEWDKHMARLLNMREVEFFAWVLRHFSDETKHLPMSGQSLQRAIEQHEELELLPVEVERMVARLVTECERSHNTRGQPRTALRRLEAMAKAAGFRSLEQAQVWSRAEPSRAALREFLTARLSAAEREAAAAGGSKRSPAGTAS